MTPSWWMGYAIVAVGVAALVVSRLQDHRTRELIEHEEGSR